MKGTHQPTGASAALATDHPPVVSALQVVNGSDLSNANAAASRGQSSALISLQAAPTLQAVPASDATIAATSIKNNNQIRIASDPPEELNTGRRLPCLLFESPFALFILEPNYPL
ncbi:hypothetical protein NL676_008712 [Syzygium grande]|nr:hypothetical protein NL676_008712 [Syzygium grande]